MAKRGISNNGVALAAVVMMSVAVKRQQYQRKSA
jgi:hypothetical protein